MAESKKQIVELKEGMVISKDIISDEGIFLVPANTIINKNHILKMQLYQVTHAFVFEESTETPKKVSVSQSTAFKSFSSRYTHGVNDLEDKLSSMIEKGNFDHQVLSEIVTGLIDSYKGDQLFTYLCRIRSGDYSTFSHSLNVSILVNIFAKWLGLSETHTLNVTIAGLLHDIGKTQIDKAILNKTGKLTPQEFESIKMHTTLGYKLIENAPIDIGIKQAVLLHHEKMNGSGYPLNISWDNIHMYAKIVSIVDIYDAITSDRPYHKRNHPFQAIQTLEEEYYSILDTDYLLVFLENIAHHFLGNDVLLSNGEEGKIIFINSHSPSRPIVQVNSTFIDLLSRSDITITKFI